uniref:Nidogen 1a n=1 Tax=Oryzias sinensis TaxID=183150 RepID=A0A8C7Z3W8_9TELE
MFWRDQGWLLWATFLGFVASAHSIRRDEFFPFGQSAGDQVLEPENDRTQRLDLSAPLLFYDRSFDSIFINTNGFVATEEPPSESTYLGKMPPSFGMIAALHGDLDTSAGVGKVFFRQDSRADVLRRAAEHINRAFPYNDEVDPTHAVVVTWVDVAPHTPHTRGDGLEKKRNSFQLVLASLQKASYAILLYARDGVQFSSTLVQGSDVIMHGGFSKGLVPGFWFTSQGPYYRTTSDEEISVRELAEQTNSGQRGVWVYEIGTSPTFSDVSPGEVTDLPTEPPPFLAQTTEPSWPLYTGEQVKNDPEQIEIHSNQYQPLQPHDPEVVELDETEINVDVFSYNFGTCSNNRNKCSQFADCRDYSSGFCCHCRPGFYGNGIQCVAEGKPQRMNGKIHGRVFVGSSPYPVELGGVDLHSYVVVNDGRSYVAISDIPETLGPSLLPLSVLGGVIGWAFALEQPGYRNGFSVIGGEFTREAEVTFMPWNEKLIIRQEFKGTDELDHLVVKTTLEGKVPEMPLGSTVTMDPYAEIYQYGSNLITSSSTREYKVNMPDGSTETRTYQCRQTITFQSCQHGDSLRDVKPSQMLSVDQVFVLYDVNNKILRYAMSNKVGDVNGGEPEENPCFTGRHGCDNNAVCRPGQGSQFTCECAAGFLGNGRDCDDIDECRENPQICGYNAVCNNQPGTYRCECEDGFQFGSDSRTCVEVDRPVNHCEDGTHDCDTPERAQCSYTGSSSFICSCLPGYVGDGRNCQDIDECQSRRCHQDADCFNTPGSFACRCRQGYRGDGSYCYSGEAEQGACGSEERDSLLGGTVFGPRGPRPSESHIPACDGNGEYEPLQCDRRTGSCWCVDRNGVEVRGTRSAPGRTPMCIHDDGGPPDVRPTPRPDVDPLPPGTHLLFAQSGRIEHVPLESYEMRKEGAKAVLHLPERVIIGVAYDCVEKVVYWTDITSPAISKASIQGGEPTTVIRTDLGSPEGITVDHIGRTIFWTDSMKDRIEVASLDGSRRRVIVDSDLINPRAIVADPVHGHLYWTDWNREAPKIETSYMDGSNRRVLVQNDLGLPNGLTYDFQSSLLCWADAGTHKMECMHPDRGDRTSVLEGIQYPFGITSYGRKIFYTDWKRNAVVAMDRHSGRESDEFQPAKQTKLYGITSAYSQCPPGRNYCSVNNGGCTHLCLATPNGRSCKCPNNPATAACVERPAEY